MTAEVSSTYVSTDELLAGGVDAVAAYVHKRQAEVAPDIALTLPFIIVAERIRALAWNGGQVASEDLFILLDGLDLALRDVS